MSEERTLHERPAEGRDWLGVLLGILLVGALHIIQLLVGYLFPAILANSFFFIGLTQLVYVIPAILIARSQGRSDIVAGIIIGAAVTFLLNAACYGLTIIGAG